MNEGVRVHRGVSVVSSGPKSDMKERMPSATFDLAKRSIFYIEDRGTDTSTPIGELIVGTAFLYDESTATLVTVI